MSRAAGALVLLVAGGCGADDGPGELTTAPVVPLFDGFDADALAPFWAPGAYGSGRYVEGAVELLAGGARSGSGCVRVTVREGDIDQAGSDGLRTERAELDSGKGPLLGQDVWTGYSLLIPEGFPVVDNRLVLSQWKQQAQGSPLVAQRYRNGRHYLTIRRPEEGDKRKLELPPLVHGKWHDMVVRIRVSTSPEDGLVQVWMDGEQVVSHRGATAFAAGEDRFYHKLGLYRDRGPEPMSIHIDSYTRGGSFEEVDPARFDR